MSTVSTLPFSVQKGNRKSRARMPYIIEVRMNPRFRCGSILMM
jgi:hypothetical protein